MCASAVSVCIYVHLGICIRTKKYIVVSIDISVNFNLYIRRFVFSLIMTQPLCPENFSLNMFLFLFLTLSLSRAVFSPLFLSWNIEKLNKIKFCLDFKNRKRNVFPCSPIKILCHHGMGNACMEYLYSENLLWTVGIAWDGFNKETINFRPNLLDFSLEFEFCSFHTQSMPCGVRF